MQMLKLQYLNMNVFKLLLLYWKTGYVFKNKNFRNASS